MPKRSAGLLLYRPAAKGFEVLIVHPGGPFWARKDLGAWSIPKGEYTDEDPLAAARREFKEEIGTDAPDGDVLDLGEAKQRSGKVVHGFALAANFDLETFKSNMFTMEWPPKSGVQQEFPECDRAAWVSVTLARKKLVAGQVPLLDALAEQLGAQAEIPDEPAGSPQTSLF